MRVFRCARLPGGPAVARPYEFFIHDDELRLEIPADQRGPDVAIADRSEQEAWIRGWGGGLKETWYCQWTFTDRSVLERLLGELETVRQPDPPVPEPPPGALVLEGGAHGNRVEVARAGDIAVAVGLADGWPRPWDVTARRGPAAYDELVAHWSKTFPVARRAASFHASRLAAELAAHDRLWVLHRSGGFDGAAKARLLDLGDRVAVELPGKKGQPPRLAICASLAEARAKLGPKDVPCHLAIPTAAELQAIAAAGPQRPRRPRTLGPAATEATRLAEAFRRLEADGVLALAGLRGPRSEGWGVVAEARRGEHLGAVFTVAGRPRHLYWVAWSGDALAFAQRVVAVLAATGLEAKAPEDEEQAITLV